MKVEVLHGGRLVSGDIRIADNPLSRIVGLMFREVPEGDGLLLDPCNSIHTFFMRYSLDVVFLSKTNEVVKVIRNLPPWRVTKIYFYARRTLEVPAGKLPDGIKEGDQLEVRYV